MHMARAIRLAIAGLLLLLCVHAEQVLDELWLRLPLVADANRLAEYRLQLPSVQVRGDSHADVAQLQTIAIELSDGLSNLLGQHVPATCCSGTAVAADAPGLLVDVSATAAGALGSEGFRLTTSPRGVVLSAHTASGALYGAFRLLSRVQRALPLPSNQTSVPAMQLRIWDLWDDLGGDVTRGYGGDSLVWPHALWKDPADPSTAPPPFRLFLEPCNPSNAFHRWTGDVLSDLGGAPSTLRNVGRSGDDNCLATDGMTVVPCESARRTLLWYNTSAKQLSLGALIPGVNGSHRRCLDIDHALGPNVDVYHCHPVYAAGGGERDYENQQFSVRTATAEGGAEADVGFTLESVSARGQCISLRNAYPPSPAAPTDISWKARFVKFARLLKSVGINGLVLNDVNACYGENQLLLRSNVLANISRNVAPTLQKYGIMPYLSICFASPTIISNVTSDPRSPLAQAWWRNKAQELNRLFNGRFGGFLVKADSEGNAGPATFNCTQADGANLLARALMGNGVGAGGGNGLVMWRAFVYGNGAIGAEELVKQAFDTFKPLDGEFDDNVVVQIKNGPMDFQVREPLHPLLGGLRKTNVMMEVQAAQEYVGQQIHAVNRVVEWKEYLDFDTQQSGKGSTIAKLLTSGLFSKSSNASSGFISGMAAVSNLGTFANWTGHVLAGSNTYGFGRLSWNPYQSAEAINTEWAQMTFPPIKINTQHAETARVSPETTVVTTVVSILNRSRAVYEGYTSPLGIGFIVFGGGGYASGHGACAPNTTTGGPPGQTCPTSPGASARLRDLRGGLDHYWVDPCSNYGLSNYSSYGLGCDRTSSSGRGTSYAAQYTAPVRDRFNNVRTCPRELLLWFHNLPWDFPMQVEGNTTISLFQFINRSHHRAVEEAISFGREWGALKGRVDDARHTGVAHRFAQQANDAAAMSAHILGQYAAWAGH